HEEGQTPSDEAQSAAHKAAERAYEPDQEPETPQEGQDTGQGPQEALERDEQGRFKPRGEAAVPPGTEEPEEELTREQKDLQRFNRNWANLQQEKEEWRQFKAAQEQQLQQRVQEYQQRMWPARATKDVFTAPDYRKYSNE